MTDHRSPPPQAEACLLAPYPSSQKGGTLIDERVVDLKVHERMLACAGYRPDSGCPHCGQYLHIHDYRSRQLVADPAVAILVVRFWCPSCEATWQVLPALVARRLWRSWSVVEQAVALDEPEPAAEPAAAPEPDVPARTRRRWLSRLASTAALLVTTLGGAERPELIAVAGVVGLDGTRAELVREYAAHLQLGRAQRLSQLAARIHRLAPGVRLM